MRSMLNLKAKVSLTLARFCIEGIKNQFLSIKLPLRVQLLYHKLSQESLGKGSWDLENPKRPQKDTAYWTKQQFWVQCKDFRAVFHNILIFFSDQLDLIEVQNKKNSLYAYLAYLAILAYLVVPNMVKWGVPEKILQNAVQTRWSYVNRTLQSKVMTKSNFWPISPL